MILHSDISSGLRRTALALHALGDADRDWLMRRLPPADQQTISGLLSELNDLGIPPDREVIKVALSESLPEESLSIDEARGLCSVLADEPAVMQSLLFSLLPPSHREAVLGNWPPDLLIRPSNIARPAWSPALVNAVMQSWRELAQLPKAQP